MCDWLGHALSVCCHRRVLVGSGLGRALSSTAFMEMFRRDSRFFQITDMPPMNWAFSATQERKEGIDQQEHESWRRQLSNIKVRGLRMP